MDPQIGDIVEVTAGRGLIRFLGTTSFSQGRWAGIELDEPNGKNDGTVQGIRYFTCLPLHGVFVRVSQVKLVVPPEEPPPQVHHHNPSSSRSEQATN
jgi:dynactin 1